MYKDKALQKKTTKDRIRRYRAKQKGVTEPVGVTAPIMPAVPMPPATKAQLAKLPPEVRESILRTLAWRKGLGILDDTEERIQRAALYQEYQKKRKEIPLEMR